MDGLLAIFIGMGLIGIMILVVVKHWENKGYHTPGHRV
jgi:uncharacterized membrane protein YqjE